MSGALLMAGPIGPQGCVPDGATDGTRRMVLNVEVTPQGVDVTFGDGTDDGDGDFLATLNADGARLMMEACAAYLDRLAAGDRPGALAGAA